MSVVQPFPERDPDTLVHTRIAVLNVQQEAAEKRHDDYRMRTDRRLDIYDQTLARIDEKLDVLHLELVELRKSRSQPPKSEKTDGFVISKGTVGAIALGVGTVLQHLVTHFLK